MMDNRNMVDFENISQSLGNLSLFLIELRRKGLFFRLSAGRKFSSKKKISGQILDFQVPTVQREKTRWPADPLLEL